MPFAVMWTEYHTMQMQSKSERERQIPYDIVYMWNLKYDTNALTYGRETVKDTENRRVAAEGGDMGEGWSGGVG